MTDEETPNMRLALAAVFGAVVVLGTADILLDVREQGATPHIVLEVVLVALALGSAVWLARGWRRAAIEVRRLGAEADRHRADQARWRADAARALAGLSAAIEAQFAAWGLTGAERATARGLLRGLSHRAIAEQDGRSERTVRQHAVAVYRKAGVAGRAELAAFFLSALPEADAPPVAALDPDRR
jgi:DNA-binding CsgD family transcriptional regulator